MKKENKREKREKKRKKKDLEKRTGIRYIDHSSSDAVRKCLTGRSKIGIRVGLASVHALFYSLIPGTGLPALLRKKK